MFILSGVSKTSTKTSATFGRRAAPRPARLEDGGRCGFCFVSSVKTSFSSAASGVGLRPFRPPLPVALFCIYWRHLTERSMLLELLEALATAYLSHIARDIRQGSAPRL